MTRITLMTRTTLMTLTECHEWPPTGVTHGFACLIWIELGYSLLRSPLASSQEMAKSRPSTSPTRQSHEVRGSPTKLAVGSDCVCLRLIGLDCLPPQVRGSPTKLAGDKMGPTVGLDSFAIQTAKKTFTVSDGPLMARHCP